MWTAIFTGLFLLFILSVRFLARAINQMVSYPGEKEKEAEQK
ncbi:MULTISPECIES: hypothetical protein [unclassified Undibacterium]